jgi:hypothetical protein
MKAPEWITDRVDRREWQRLWVQSFHLIKGMPKAERAAGVSSIFVDRYAVQQEVEQSLEC